jgi:hypothetical protein
VATFTNPAENLTNSKIPMYTARLRC